MCTRQQRPLRLAAVPCSAARLVALMLTHGDLWPAAAGAQGELHGTVYGEGPPRVRLAGVAVTVGGLEVRATSDSAGRFRLASLPEGEHRVALSAPGYSPDTFPVAIGWNESVTREFVLRPAATALRAVRVSAERTETPPAKLAGFEERRRAGPGRFLDRVQIERWEGRKTADLLATVPGVDVRRSVGSKAWITSGRAVSPHGCAFCRGTRVDVLDPADMAAGAGLACYADVYVDGAMAFSSALKKAPLFDINGIPVSQIAAIEFYASAASVPAQYNRTSGGCGVLLIWTR